MTTGGLQIGTDPEFTISGKGKDFVSAIQALKGHGKANKLQISDGQYCFFDNVLMEFNVAPAFTFREFRENFKRCLAFSGELLGKQGLNLTQVSSCKFPANQCEDEEAWHLGCDPEFCIYNKDEAGRIQMVDPPELAPGNTFRSCGGHIHIGHSIATIDRGDPVRVVKLMDIFVGSNSLLLDFDSTSAARRALYGGAGTHRLAPYGLEYRTLSNFWLASPRIAEIIFRLTRLAVQLAVAIPNVGNNLIEDGDLQGIINKGSVTAAKKLFEKTKDLMSDDLQDKIKAWQENPATNTLEEEWEINQPNQKVA